MNKSFLDEQSKKTIREKFNIDVNSELFSPMVDFAFKRLFTADEIRSKLALIDFINSVMEFENDKIIMDLTIKNPEIPVVDGKHKKSIFDIRATLKDGEQIIIEMQLSKHGGFIKRSHSSISKVYSSQEISGLDYTTLKKCYLINITNFSITDKEYFVNDYRFRDKEGNDLSDDMTIVFIELDKLDKILNKPVSEMTNVEMWSLFFKYVTDASKREIMSEILDRKEEIGMAATILKEISQNEKERIQYENDLMAEMDYYTGIAEAKREGIQEGIKEGIQEGIKEGIQEGIQNVAKVMIMKGMDTKTIVDITNLSTEEIQALKDKI